MFKNKFLKFSLYICFVAMLISLSAIYNTSATNKTETMGSKYLVPGGEVIGIKLYTKGVHVVDTGFIDTVDGEKSPAKEAGIKSGDFIIKVDGVDVDTIEKFSTLIQNNKELSITYTRKGKMKTTVLTPVLSSVDNSFKAGLLIRDSTAGIGTLTFYDPETKLFGALGHGINDQDTGKLLTLKNGKVYKAHLTSVVKSQNGVPGEINGTFIGENNNIGTLELNSYKGVFGKLNTKLSDKKTYKVAEKDEIKMGEAYIMCSVENDTVKEYKIEIINVVKNSPFKNEGLTIKITDPKLLSITDGILQGMSGSPILQNDKIVGAVTHVFVNDPTRGYGIFIENMLAEAEKSK